MGPIPRVGLAREMGLTGAAISKITSQLLKQKLIKLEDRIMGMRGQPAQNLGINADGAYAIGVNVDRDHLTFVVLDFGGAVRFRASRDIDFPLPADFLDFVAQSLEAVKRQRVIATNRLIGIGVGVPDDMGTIVTPGQPPEYAEWSKFDIHKTLSDIYPMPNYVENDAAAASIGELQFGRGLIADTFYYILLTSGLGGGVVIDGQYRRGSHGRSGEIGFLPIFEPGQDIDNGSDRTLGDVFIVKELLDALRHRGHDLKTVADLDKMIEVEPGLVDEWISRAVGHMALPLLGVIYTIDPKCILVGGRLPRAFLTRFTDALSRTLEKHHKRIALPPIAPGDLSEDAAALGAAALAFNDRFFAYVRGIEKAS